MALSVRAEKIPIKIDKDGVARAGGTRVTLDTVVAAYEREHSVEKIVSQYDVLTLADVHYVIGYFLSHRAEVEAYLQERDRQAAIIRAQVEAVQGTQEGLRGRLLARRPAGK